MCRYRCGCVAQRTGLCACGAHLAAWRHRLCAVLIWARVVLIWARPGPDLGWCGSGHRRGRGGSAAEGCRRDPAVEVHATHTLTHTLDTRHTHTHTQVYATHTRSLSQVHTRYKIRTHTRHKTQDTRHTMARSPPPRVRDTHTHWRDPATEAVVAKDTL
eukprot:2548099-Rhodomonas_salina.1